MVVQGDRSVCQDVPFLQKKDIFSEEALTQSDIRIDFI